MSEAADRLRVLCVHGYRQSGSAFREKTGALRKLLKKQAELVYFNAPHRILPQKGESSEEESRGWWFSDVQEQSFDAKQLCESSLGLEVSVEAVRAVVKELGPFDGVLGFSQGAALVAMLCALQEQSPQSGFSFRFAILVAGFRSACSEHRQFYQGPPIGIPTLHVFGERDGVIQEDMSRELLPLFAEAQVLLHHGGHHVPAASSQRQVYQDFLRKFQDPDLG